MRGHDEQALPQNPQHRPRVRLGPLRLPQGDPLAEGGKSRVPCDAPWREIGHARTIARALALALAHVRRLAGACAAGRPQCTPAADAAPSASAARVQDHATATHLHLPQRVPRRQEQ
eukprot:scaffold7401_cov296-Prasinococcus_capsulatus_cf.AAC.1